MYRLFRHHAYNLLVFAALSTGGSANAQVQQCYSTFSDGSFQKITLVPPLPVFHMSRRDLLGAALNSTHEMALLLSEEILFADYHSLVELVFGYPVDSKKYTVWIEGSGASSVTSNALQGSRDDLTSFFRSACKGYGLPSRPAPRIQPGASLRSSGMSAQSFTLADFNGDGVPDRAKVFGFNGIRVDLLGSDANPLSAGGQQITVGANNGYVLAADFDQDGKMDLAVSNAVTGFAQSGSAIYVLLGNGDGTFQKPKTIAAGNTPMSFATGDFNSDGKPDLAVVNVDSTISVLLGKGDGTFQAPVSYPVGSGANSIVVLDLNADGKPDLAVYSATSNTISGLLGKGDGTFQKAISSPGAPGGNGDGSLAFADLNGDGKPDLVLAYAFTNVLSIFTGNGDGSFRSPLNYAGPTHPKSIGALALGDGSFAVFAIDEWTNQVYVMLSPGDGTLNAPRMDKIGQSFIDGSAADLNQDGVPDVVLADQSAKSLLVQLNDGTGNLRKPVTYAVANSPNSVAIADVNGDSLPDLVASYSDLSNSNSGLAVLLNKGDGTFGAPANFPAGPSPGKVLMADLNGDGKPDAIVLSSPTVSSQPAGVSVLLGHSGGGFDAPVAYSFGSQRAVSIAVGDFNGDGKPDLAVATINSPTTYNAPGTIYLLLGKGDGTFQAGIQTAIGNPASIAIGDFNGDGNLDIALSEYSLTLGTNGKYFGTGIQTLLGAGDGTFSAGPFVSTVFAGKALFAADLNGDGIADLINTGRSGETNSSVLFGNGDGSFATELAVLGPQSSAGVAVADLNGDGRPDLVLPSSGGYAPILSNTSPYFLVTPDALTLHAGQTQQFTAVPMFGVDPSVSWSISPQIGTISDAGLYTAPDSIAAPQLIKVMATSASGSGYITLTLQ